MRIAYLDEQYDRVDVLICLQGECVVGRNDLGAGEIAVLEGDLNEITK